MLELLIKTLYFISWACSIVFAVKMLAAIFKLLVNFNFLNDLSSKKYGYLLKMTPLTVSLLLFGAVWPLRFAVGVYSVYYPREGAVLLTPSEELFNSLVHTLQTFSLDEDYKEYIAVGREMMAAFFGAGTKWVDVYGVYAAVLNFLVPFAGGAIVLEIISEFFPKLSLMFASFRIWTEKYYFSELNDHSLALAKSIAEIKKSKACIVFTDAYTDDKDEIGSERLMTAKSIGAICLKDDLMDLKLRGRAPKIFLIDASEISNLQALAALLDRRTRKVINSEIFVFSSDKKYSNIDEDVAMIVNQAGSTDMIPTVIPVNGIRNMAYRLFDQIPLYEPLLNRDQSKEKTLTVTILGSGVIGTEFFLTTYWCGQMLDCKLHINVISKEKRNKNSTSDREGDFEGRINYINPDILESKDPDSELLIYSDNGERSEPYFSYDYRESDVMSDDFISLMKDPELLNTDYFIVALGSDGDNLEVANKLRQIVGVHHVYDAPGKKVVISYVIYNSDLCRALNKKQGYMYDPETNDAGKEVPDIWLYAFGDLDSVYSAQNVFLEGITNSAYELSKVYDAQKSILAAEQKRKKNKNKRFKDIYSYQSDIARRLHKKYKMFSAGVIRKGIFTENTDEGGEAESPEKLFAELITEPIDKNKLYVGRTKQRLLNELAWLEHRRWCAYLRTKGFSNPGKGMYERYFMLSTSEHDEKSHKFVSLKLHPCLVECSKKGINARFDDRGFVITESERLSSVSNDYLDDLSIDRAKKLSESEYFKHWDYPEFDLGSDEIPFDDKLDGSGPFDVSGMIEVRSVYLSDEKKYVSVLCFEKTVKNRYRSYMREAGKKSDEEIDLIMSSARFNTAFDQAMDELRSEKVKPFDGLDVEMIEYGNVDLWSNRLLNNVESAVFSRYPEA